jgi:serine phosphatase RsbU (regulator of sigma subunit)
VDAHVTLPGLEAWVFAVPHANAASGGDVHFVSSCGSGRITRMMLADVAGHGERVAQTARDLRRLMQRFMNQVDQRSILRELNRAYGELSTTGRFATTLVTTFFAPTRQLSICNAGHPPPLLYRKARDQWRFLDDQIESPDVINTPLGILDDVTYEQFVTELDPGDLLFCYTDSLPESHSRDGTMLDAVGLLRAVESLNTRDASTFIPRLLEKLPILGTASDDDVTLMLFHATGEREAAPLGQRLRANLRMLRMLVRRDGPFPWPEFDLRNLGGAVLRPLSRVGKRR